MDDPKPAAHSPMCACRGWGEFYLPDRDQFVPCTGTLVPDSSQERALRDLESRPEV